MTTTYSTPNSSHNYSVPADPDVGDVLVRGGVGGDGGDSNTGESGGSGGAGGTLEVRIPVTGGETLSVAVGQAGTASDSDGSFSAAGGAGESAPLAGGVTGGAGGDGELGGDGGPPLRGLAKACLAVTALLGVSRPPAT